MTLRKVILVGCSILISLVLLEAALRILSAKLIYSPKNSQVYDERLGRRIDPSLPDIDENGFRNPDVPEDTGVVVLGDSHTYGVNVKSGESWPAQLGRMSGLSVYNMGVGGYGPLQYYYLMDKAVRMKPERIILALFPANDLSDVCKLMDESDYWRAWGMARGYDVDICKGAASFFGRINRSLSGLHVYWMAASAIKRFNESMDFGDAISIDDPKNPTIIKYATMSSRRRKMDLSRERISLGLEITEEVIREMKRKADAAGIELDLLLIPSKERVFFDYLRGKGYDLSEDYRELAANEDELIAEFSRFLGDLGIDFSDARPYVLRELYGSGYVYSTTDDGHPLEAGYRAYARAAYEDIIADDVPAKDGVMPGR